MAMTATVSSSSTRVRPAVRDRRGGVARRATHSRSTKRGFSSVQRGSVVGIGLTAAVFEQGVLLLQQFLDLAQFADHVGSLIDRIGERRLAGLRRCAEG